MGAVKSPLMLLDDAIKTNKFEPIYVFYGNERGVLFEYLTEVKSRFKNVVETDDLNAIIEDTKFNSIFGGKKLYIMRDTELFNKKATEEFLQFLAKMLKQRMHTIIFIENNVDNSVKQTQALPNSMKIQFNQLHEDQLVALVNTVLNEHNKKATKDIVRYFIDMCGYDYNTITNELSKLISYTTDSKIELDTINKVCSKNSNAVVFDLVNYIVKGQYGRALDMYETLILRKESPLVILTLIYRQLRLLYQIKLLKMSGVSNIQELAELCDSTPYIIEKNLNISNFDVSKILDLLVKCDEYDFKIKTGVVKDITAVRLLILYSSIR